MTRATPQPAPDLIVIGASARAACFSAARAGLSPYWIDQFGDSDLRAAFPGVLVSPGAYPAGLVPALEQAPDAPVMFTGALENHHAVLRKIGACRLLLGNSAAVCAAVRSPALLRERLAAHGIRFPQIAGPGTPAPATGHWLLKPERSGGGLGIRSASRGMHATPGHYLQEFMPGESFSGVFVAGAGCVQLLGVTRQMVGEGDFHAPPFSWCGSLGPVLPAPQAQSRWEEIGRALADEFGLRGLFGVDAVVGNDDVTVIEVNPRYTASVEVLEAALGISAITLHVAAWGQVLHRGVRANALTPLTGPSRLDARPDPMGVHGKACLFAPGDTMFNETARAWCSTTELSHAGIDAAVHFADVPAPGTPVPPGAPILTVLCRAGNLDDCAVVLRQLAAGVYDALGYPGSGRMR